MRRIAKVEGPLFSFETSGKIGKTLVYKKWKKVDNVRKYIVPGNPQTDIQQAQRENYKIAFEAWRKDGYTSKDLEAWNLYANAKRVKASGWNMFNKFYIKSKVDLNTWTKLYNCLVPYIYTTKAKVTINTISNKTAYLYLGTSKTCMFTPFLGVFLTNKYTFSLTGLAKNTKYFFYIKNTGANEAARTGIYSFSIGETPNPDPTPIDIGSPAVNRPGVTGAGYTNIEVANPSNGSGKITKVEIFVAVAMTNVEVGIFFIVSGNYLSTRSHVALGNLTVGYHDFTVDLEVKIGDYIGIYMASGGIEYYTAGGLGQWYKAGDYIPCTNVLFGRQYNTIISLYGTGETI